MDVIAEHRLEVLYPDGTLVPVCLRVGRPSRHEKRHFACSVQAEGLRLWQGPREFAGVDTFQALMLGVQFLHKMLSIEVENGAVLHWEGGKEHLKLSDLFGILKV